jgi:HTH-type transcriptional regulator/antitoxin HipB
MTRLRGEIPTAEALGRMLQQGRLVRGLSQRELADQLGIGQKWVWEMEGGKPGIFTERLFRILRATGVHLYAEIDVPDDVGPPAEPPPAEPPAERPPAEQPEPSARRTRG